MNRYSCIYSPTTLEPCLICMTFEDKLDLKPGDIFVGIRQNRANSALFITPTSVAEL